MGRVLQEQISRYGLYDLTLFLYRSDLVSKEDFQALETYRQRRNKIIHEFLKDIPADRFENELKVVYEEGRLIVDGKKFEEIRRYADIPDGNLSHGAREEMPAPMRVAPRNTPVVASVIPESFSLENQIHEYETL